ncbi:DUF6609 family protein [Stackebrandtia soli]|uniref:DUF6609 family protein n=1 Tax=Stackebrandtia soli TaxID=1892856 RepID=UPI0039E7D1FA
MNASLSLLSSVADAHPFPLIRGGGLFLMCVGAGFLLGWLLPRWWVPLAIGGGAAGIIASGLSALLPSLGTPSWIHIAALAGSIVLEMGLIYLVVSRYKDADERTMILAILFVVGLHFITMGAAHGPLIAILGVVTAANAAIGWYAKAVPLRVLGIVDALLKLGFGAVMLLAYPALTYF